MLVSCEPEVSERYGDGVVWVVVSNCSELGRRLESGPSMREIVPRQNSLKGDPGLILWSSVHIGGGNVGLERDPGERPRRETQVQGMRE